MKTHVDTAVISHELALDLVARAVAIGDARGVRVAVAIVDPGLGLVAYLRANGTTPHSAETSRRKAQTAASTRRSTGWMAGDFALTLPIGSGNLLTNILGGVPIVVDGLFLGGLGVAGGTPEADAEIASAVLASIGVGDSVMTARDDGKQRTTE
jgi:glc operon protein GlcG